MSQLEARRATISRAVGRSERSRSTTNAISIGRKRRLVLFAMLAGVSLNPALATETITYSYDALGRLVKTTHSGTVNNGATSCYVYDRASNRSNVKVTTSADCNNPGVGVSFSVASNGPVPEGSSSAFTVTKNGNAFGTLTVVYATASGSATSGSDFTTASGTLTFLAGETSKTFSVSTTDDALFEGVENFSANLSNPSGSATIGTGTALATINDNDLTPSFTISDASVTEGGNLVFTVTKSGSTSASFTVNYGTANGSALAGSDYGSTSGTLTFGPSVSSLTVSVPTVNDSVAEVTENLTLNLSGASGGSTISDSQGLGTIADNDVPTFSVGNASVSEGGTLVFPVAMTGQTAINFSVNYGTSNGTALATSDYTSNSGTLTFGPSAGSATQNVNVTTFDDSLSESNETVLLNLSGASGGAGISPAQATGTIVDNDPTCGAVSYSISDGANYEGQAVGFTVTKSGSASINCSVNYSTADGSAAAPGDYQSGSGTLTFTPGQSSQQISIQTFSNGISPEGTRWMTVNLSSPSNSASIGDAQGVGTLWDDGTSSCQTRFCDEGPLGLTSSKEGTAASSTTSAATTTATPAK